MVEKISLEEEVLDSDDVSIIRSEVEGALLETRPSRIQKRTAIEIDLTKVKLIDDAFYDSLFEVCKSVYTDSYVLAAETIMLIFSKRSEAWKDYLKRKLANQYFNSKGV